LRVRSRTLSSPMYHGYIDCVGAMEASLLPTTVISKHFTCCCINRSGAGTQLILRQQIAEMSEIVHAGFESPTLSFVRDLTIAELIGDIVDNVDVYAEAMEAVAMLETDAVCGAYRGTGWSVWFWRTSHTGSIH